MPHILFICTANICRSPVAEGAFRHALQQQGMTDWTTASAGTWAMMTRGASANSVTVMANRNIDISRHRARMVDEPMLAQADLVLCMESGHVEALRAEFPAQAHKIFLLTAMIGRNYSISDPYGRSLDLYERMAQDVEAVLQNGFQEIVTRAADNAAKPGTSPGAG